MQSNKNTKEKKRIYVYKHNKVKEIRNTKITIQYFIIINFFFFFFSKLK